jgi:hypothetical protein
MVQQNLTRTPKAKRVAQYQDKAAAEVLRCDRKRVEDSYNLEDGGHFAHDSS